MQTDPDSSRARPDPARHEPGVRRDPADDPEVHEAVGRLLAHAESLLELSLDGVDPAFAPPRWE